MMALIRVRLTRNLKVKYVLVTSKVHGRNKIF